MDARPSHYLTQRRPALTARQEEVLALLARGYTNGQVAEALGITLDGAKFHVSEILDRLGVESRDDAVAAWRADRGAWQKARRATRAFIGGTALLAGSVAGIAALVVAVGVLVVTRDDGPAEQAAVLATATPTLPPTPVVVFDPPQPQPELTFVSGSHSLPRWMLPGADLTQTVGVLAGDMEDEIQLVEPATGFVVGRLEVGYGPWALFRRTAGELLISHVPFGPPLADGGREFAAGPTLLAESSDIGSET